MADAKTVFIQGSLNYGMLAAMFVGYGWKRSPTIEEADAICWAGGADIDPMLYGEAPIEGTYFDPTQDEEDIDAYVRAEGKFLIGICRGAQLLHVMNGGSLWQDVDNHWGTHSCVDVRSKRLLQVSSLHHQMLRPNDNMEIVATATEATFKKAEKEGMRIDGPDQYLTDRFKDIEVAWYPNTRSLCFQPHPEYDGSCSTREYFYSLIGRFI